MWDSIVKAHSVEAFVVLALAVVVGVSAVSVVYDQVLVVSNHLQHVLGSIAVHR